MRSLIVSKVFLALGLGALLLSCSAENSFIPLDQNSFSRPINISPKVIYGTDDRMDWFEVEDQRLLTLARSTAGLVDKADVQINNDGTAVVTTSKYELCPSEKFSDQEIAPWCSAFLVGPDLMVTAGHCIEYQNNCTDIAVVFGYANKTSSNNPALISQNDVYTCKTVIARRETNSSADWAVIQLDRPVVGRASLKIRRTGTVTVNTPLLSIGHPTALPSKITTGGTVLELQKRYFKTDLDAFTGSSGSAVFNAQTLEVEGVVSRGKTDYIFNKKEQCLISNVCEEGLNGDCTAPVSKDLDSEHITKITEAVAHIPEVITTPPPKEGEGEEENKDPNTYFSGGPYKIRDNSLKITISVIKNVPKVSSLEKVQMKLKHSYISDLTIKLIAPNGKSIFLHKRAGETKKDVIGVYGEHLNPYQKLSVLGPQEAGDWRLEVKDHAPYDDGTLIKWGIIL